MPFQARTHPVAWPVLEAPCMNRALFFSCKRPRSGLSWHPWRREGSNKPE